MHGRKEKGKGKERRGVKVGSCSERVKGLEGVGRKQVIEERNEAREK